MKRPLLLLLFTIVIISCQKDNDNNNSSPCDPDPLATFKYKYNGTLLEMNGSLAQNAKEGALLRKEQVVGSGNLNPNDNANGDPFNNTNYIISLIATRNYYYSDDGEPIIEIELRTNALTGPQVFNSQNIKYLYTYYPYQSGLGTGTSFTVNITKVENGFADGTFSGTVKRSIGGQIDQITEGEFKNVKILQ